ncbi:hypothetical protein BsWGS_07776 [Bradybaena similaris]
MASKTKSVSSTYRQKKRTSQPYSKAVAKPITARAPPVSEAEKELSVLKKFDLTLEYGPCIGITRLERWERADKHGLNPPTEVRTIISKHSKDETYIECLWNDYSTLK